MVRKYFGTDGIRGRANGADHARARAEGRAGGGPDLPARRASPPRADRQGHAAVRLHDRDRAGRGLHLGRHGRAADRPDADAGGRHADALDARRSRRDDLGLAQSLRRQRHQAVRSRRLQALRRGRARDRGADRRRPRQAARQARPISAAPSASTASQDRYIEFAKRTLPRNLSLDGLRIVVDCANGAAYQVAPEALWELGAEVIAIGVEPDGFNINRECGSTAARGAVPARCARCAPISASRSTATPTAC